VIKAEILLSLVFAIVGVYLLIGVARESARRGRGPGGVRAELATTAGDLPGGGAAPAVPREATDPAAGVVAIGEAPAAPALLPASTGESSPVTAGESVPDMPLPTPDLPVHSGRTPAPPAPGLSNGVRNSRFARYDRSGRPAAMGSPYLR
jgi:hypothetical protein